jgi:hypothetical protein
VVIPIQSQHQEIWRGCQGGYVRLDKALGVFEIVIFSVVLLLFAIEEFKGLCLVFLLVASSPIFDNFYDLVGHGEEGDCMVFFDDTHVDVKDLVCALAIASGAEEHPRECARVYSVGNGCIIMGFDFWNQVCNQGQSCGGVIGHVLMLTLSIAKWRDSLNSQLLVYKGDRQAHWIF